MSAQETLVHAVTRQVQRGLRESLMIAAQRGSPVDDVNAVLQHLQTVCDDCTVLTRPYAAEPRVVVTVVTAREQHWLTDHNAFSARPRVETASRHQQCPEPPACSESGSARRTM